MTGDVIEIVCSTTVALVAELIYYDSVLELAEASNYDQGKQNLYV